MSLSGWCGIGENGRSFRDFLGSTSITPAWTVPLRRSEVKWVPPEQEADDRLDANRGDLRHPALLDAWRDVATAGSLANKLEAFQEAALAIATLVESGEIERVRCSRRASRTRRGA